MIVLLRLLLILSACFAPAVQAAAFPKVEVEPCCSLCPAAADESLYQTKFLSSFRTLVQGREGWLFRTESDLLMDLDLSAEGLDRLSRFNEALAQRNVTLVMVVQPPRGLMHADKLGDVLPVPYDADLVQMRYAGLLNQMRARGIVVPELEKLGQQGGRENYFFRGDHHWTPEGARRTAQLVAERVQTLPAYADMPRQRFVTRRDGLFGKRGTLDKAAQMLCGHGAPEQFVPRWVTEPAEAEGAGDLFGDDAAPQVALVGTSNSDTPYNFAGFLSEFLHSDVLNVAMPGGGFEGAMLGYLPSAEFQSAPPRIMIWEVETYHDVSDARFYQQAMPLMGRECGGQPPVLERKLTLRAGRNEVLFNGGGAVRQLRGKRHFLDLRFDDPAVRELRAVVWYLDGTKDTMRIERSQRDANRGRFVLDLRDEAPWGDAVFISLDLEWVSPAMAGATNPSASPEASAPMGMKPPSVHARLCQRDPTHGPAIHASAEH